MKRTHTCGELRAEHTGQTVTLQGWVSRVREFPGTRFIVLRDRTGIVQVTVDSENSTFQIADDCRSEFVLEVEGIVRLREAANRSTQYATGEIEIVPIRLEILNRAKPVPFPVDGAPVTASEDVRMKYRMNFLMPKDSSGSKRRC